MDFLQIFFMNFLEGVVPFELYMCIQDLITKKYICLEMINQAIKEFVYSFSDKTDKPQSVPKTFASGMVMKTGVKSDSFL